MGHAFSAAIRIVYSNHDDGNKDGRDDARSAVKSGGCCAAKNNSSLQNLCTEGAPAPTEVSDAVSEKPNRPQSAVRAAEAAVMVDCRRLKRPKALSRLGHLRYHAKFNNMNKQVLWNIESKIILY